MKHLFSAEGEAALARTLARTPLLAFDFDGTLAPIVASPDDASVATPVALRLARLAERLPLAIVTGRALRDVRQRLSFEPHYIVGNHGAEEAEDAAEAQAYVRALDALRLRLRQHEALLAAAGVTVEDKGPSIALHYRLARDRAVAQQAIDDALTPLPPGGMRFDGKMVVNIAAAQAPDKAGAVRRLLHRSGAGSAFFAGDDINDEPVFRAATADWLTVRVGHLPAPSAAHYMIDGPHEMAPLLQRMLELLDRLPTAPSIDRP